MAHLGRMGPRIREQPLRGEAAATVTGEINDGIGHQLFLSLKGKPMMDEDCLNADWEARVAAADAIGGSMVAGKAATDEHAYWAQTRSGLNIVFESLEVRGTWVTLFGARVMNMPKCVEREFYQAPDRLLDLRVEEIILLADCGS